MTLPLTGVVVLDLADEPVALASRLLADLGADVVRVEDAAGDALRSRGPFVGDEPGVERGLAHILYNAGKRSLALALERPEAWEVVDKVAGRCDIVIAPLGKTARAREFLGSRPWGEPGQAGLVDAVFRRGSEDEATDLIGTAAGGLLHLNGYPEDPPNHPAGNLAYKQLSLAAAFAAMAQVLERGNGGAAGRVEVAMQEAVMWTTIQTANENYWHWHQARPGRRGLQNLGGQTIFLCGDGQWVSFYHHPPAWPAFARWVAEALGEERFLQPEWDDGMYRYQHNDEVTPVTTRLCASLNRAALIADAQRRSILVVPVQGVADIAADPHLRERGFFQRVWYEQLDAELEVLRAPFISSAYTMQPRPAPALGEHSRDVLEGLCGMDAAAVDALAGHGIVGMAREGARA